MLKLFAGVLLGLLVLLGVTSGSQGASNEETKGPRALDFTVDSIDGKPVDLSQYKGKVVLIVNVASKCGFTPQYKGLEGLYEKYSKDGLVILGFPSNDFGRQEPGSNEQISEFCHSKFGVK